MPMTDAEVFETVRDLLVQALAVEPAAVAPDARIMDDLDAESIDLLDLRFRLEKAFAIRITAKDLAAAFEGVTSAEQFRERFTVTALCRYIARRLEAGGS